MDPEATNQIETRTVLYHCTCGEQLVLKASEGGECSKCSRSVSPKLLEQDLGMTVSLTEENVELDQTLALGFGADDEDFSMDSSIVSPIATTAPEDLNGQMFGHFKLVVPLGSGGMGQVYRAFDTSLQRYVAVKLLRSGIGGSTHAQRSSDKEVEKLLQEAVSQARVTHPNIVTIYYVGKQDSNPFLAMELVNGEPLSDRVAKGMSFDEIAPIALDITNALQYSFDLDIIHGDIKPSNVLINKGGMAKLSDFGMARSPSKDKDKSIGGTPNYIAPELLKGALPSIQSDIYALGVTFFEMTFGKLPRTLTGTRIAQWIEIHNNTELEFPVPWPPGIPEIWQAVLIKMLAQDPADRFQSYSDLLAVLKRLQPASNIDARLFPRLIAAGIDWASALSLAVVLQVGIGFSVWPKLGDLQPLMTFLLHACNFLPIIGYTILTYFWRQSIGRSLMHIRVVNQFGMRPSRNIMVIRSAIRMQFPWIVIALELFRTQSGSFTSSVLLSSIYMLSIMFLMFDLAFIVLYSKHRAIHDVVTKTRVVLDTNDAT